MREKIERLVRGFVKGYPNLNQTRTDWDSPLVGFVDAADPLCEELKAWVSDTHFLPGDLLPDARTVIIYFIPFNRKRCPQQPAGRKASLEWATAYIETNKLFVELNTSRRIPPRRITSGQPRSLPPTTSMKND